MGPESLDTDSPQPIRPEALAQVRRMSHQTILATTNNGIVKCPASNLCAQGIFFEAVGQAERF